MITVKVDFNETNRLGQIKTRAAKADGPIAVGDFVRAWDPYEDMERIARVDSIGQDGNGHILLDIFEDRHVLMINSSWSTSVSVSASGPWTVIDGFGPQAQAPVLHDHAEDDCWFGRDNQLISA